MLMRSRSLVLPGLIMVFFACSAPPGQGTQERPEATAAAIINGSKESADEEAELVDMYQGGQPFAACYASVIAPTVVLTAGHCVDNITSWKVTTPYAGNQKAN